MKTSIKGIELLKKYEGWASKPYVDPGTGGKPYTIGYGNTFYEGGVKVKMTDAPISKERGLELLKMILPAFEKIVDRKITIELNQNQFDAILSYVYNTGGSDTLYKLINQNSSIDMIKTWWTTKYITGGGRILQGLVKRRNEEFNLFIS